MSEKLQKVLANAGLGSRRKMETWIEAGRISVNGVIAQLGARVISSDEIRCDGRLLPTAAKQVACRVLIYNKPEGEICSRDDPEGRTTVFARLPRIQTGRWIAIGRLDMNTSGLLLFTNDGELANRLMHPSREVEREYAVRVFGEVTASALQAIRQGVTLEDGVAKFDQLKRRPQGAGEALNTWFDVVIREGRKREVRRIWETQGVQISRLIRTRYGDTVLPRRLPQGAWMEMPLADVNSLRRAVQLPNETATQLKPAQQTLDHVRLSRMRRAIKKHKLQQTDGEGITSKGVEPAGGTWADSEERGSKSAHHKRRQRHSAGKRRKQRLGRSEN